MADRRQKGAVTHLGVRQETAPRTLEECRRCDLWNAAAQPVSGSGPKRARLVLIGEQPGNEEDLQGKPFVGPAGRVLDKAPDLRLTDVLGSVIELEGRWLVPTYHPSCVLRQRDDRARAASLETIVDALARAAPIANRGP